MKKISAVLLVLVLVGSVAFAGFTGSATTSFGYNLDSGAYGFLSNGTAVSVDVVFLSEIGEAKGDGDVYASIKATLDFSFDNGDASDLSDADSMIIGANLDFDHAKIIGDNWYVGILGTLVAPNFATSVIEATDVAAAAHPLGYAVDDDSQAVDLRPRDYVTQNGLGVEVGIADFVASLGFTGNTKTEVYNLFATVATPELELAEGVTAKVGAAALISDAKNAFSGSVKVAYADDDLAVSVASDMIYDAEFMTDVALAASYTDYSLDVYFATDANRGGYTNQENLLSAKVAAAIDPVTVTLTGKNLLDGDNGQALGLSVKFDATDELAVTARGGFKMSDKSWNGGADVVYTTDEFVAKLGGTYYSTERIALNASIETESIVPGATLKLAYAGDDLTEADLGPTRDNGNLGKVVASVKIAF